MDRRQKRNGEKGRGKEKVAEKTVTERGERREGRWRGEAVRNRRERGK